MLLLGLGQMRNTLLVNTGHQPAPSQADADSDVTWLTLT